MRVGKLICCAHLPGTPLPRERKGKDLSCRAASQTELPPYAMTHSAMPLQEERAKSTAFFPSPRKRHCPLDILRQPKRLPFPMRRARETVRTQLRRARKKSSRGHCFLPTFRGRDPCRREFSASSSRDGYVSLYSLPPPWSGSRDR